MKWKTEPTPFDGQTRLIYKFLWFPLTIGDETRWLEMALVEERFRWSVLNLDNQGPAWKPIRFVPHNGVGIKNVKKEN